MRYHKGRDGWGRDSYAIPQYAVVGSSDCGSHFDSPAPTENVREELEQFRTILRSERIRSRLIYTRSGNAFMVKRWVVVHSKDFVRASTLAERFLREQHETTRYVHDAA